VEIPKVTKWLTEESDEYYIGWYAEWRGKSSPKFWNEFRNSHKTSEELVRQFAGKALETIGSYDSALEVRIIETRVKA